MVNFKEIMDAGKWYFALGAGALAGCATPQGTPEAPKVEVPAKATPKQKVAIWNSAKKTALADKKVTFPEAQGLSALVKELAEPAVTNDYNTLKAALDPNQTLTLVIGTGVQRGKEMRNYLNDNVFKLEYEGEGVKNAQGAMGVQTWEALKPYKPGDYGNDRYARGKVFTQIRPGQLKELLKAAKNGMGITSFGQTLTEEDVTTGTDGNRENGELIHIWLSRDKYEADASKVNSPALVYKAPKAQPKAPATK